MFYTYVLQSLKDYEFYTGYTNDLQKRFAEHNKGLNDSTKHRRPFKLIYYEVCLNEKDAKQREKYLKSGRGKLFLEQRLKNYFSNSESYIT